ncbi:MAG: protein kinase [Bryobacteraceae bacterium]|nr:protein kinase [Bryobacteraceae bacterium]
MIRSDRLAHFQILEKIGEGGMSEVWKAQDTRLGRNVAIKILPRSQAQDEERLRRFEHEARTAGALNHPNILAIYDTGLTEGRPYLVTELLEGQTLRDALERGPLPPRRVVDCAQQILRGLSAAHHHGIVHRDLKPENVFLTKDGMVKILDFGLAKASITERFPHANDETLTISTNPGTVLGTVGYMSPEQVRGEEAGPRSDIFSFGLILYEMLCGKRAFHCGSAVETMSLILSAEPAPIPTSPNLERLVHRCIEKRPEDRFDSARDVLFALEAAAGGSGSSPSLMPVSQRRRRSRTRLALTLACGLIAGAAIGRWLLPSKPPAPPQIRYLTYSGRDSSPAVTQDGRTVAFISERDGTPRIWLKQLADGSEVALTEGPDDSPRFSPDGSTVLFARTEGTRTSLFRVPLLGGEPRRVLDDAINGDFSPDGKRVAFVRWRADASGESSIIGVVDSDGSNPRVLTELPGARVEMPRWSPDGTKIAAVGAIQGGFRSGFYVTDLAGTVRRYSTRRDMGISGLAWLPSSSEVVYIRGDYMVGTLSEVVRHSLTADTLETLHWPHRSACIDLLRAGALVFDTVGTRSNLRRVEGGGAASWITRGTSMDRQPVFSPDGSRVAFSSDRSGNTDLWQITLDTGKVTRLTDHEADDIDPAFTPDGRSLLWTSSRAGHFEVFLADADGGRPRQITRDGADAENPTMTRDGRWIVYASANPAKSGIWRIRPDGSDGASLVGGTHFNPEVSPDGRYALYVTSPKPALNLIRVVTVDDGVDQGFEIRCPIRKRTPVVIGRARWRPDGKAILFIGQDERGVHGVFEQDFVPGKDTSASLRPVAGFDSDLTTESLAVAPDGRSMVISGWDRVSTLLLADRLPGLGKGLFP